VSRNFSYPGSLAASMRCFSMLVTVGVGLAAACSVASEPAPAAIVAATEFSAGIAPSQPVAIVAGPDGSMWFTERGPDGIGRITPDGTVTQYRAGITRGAAPYAIAASPDGNIWFTETGRGRVARITPSGKVTEFSAGISSNARPEGIAAGPDGNLWFTEAGADRSGRITPSGAVTEFGIMEGANPRGIVAGPDGNLWFTENNSDEIGRITPAGAVTEFSTHVGEGWPDGPYAIAAGPDGNLWFTEYDSHRIGRITPSGKLTQFGAGITSGAGPDGIAAGSDGNLWFTERGLDRVGRITPSGVVTEFGAGITPGATPHGIAAGSDGNLWFAEFGVDRVGRVTAPSGPTLSVTKAGVGQGTVTSSRGGIVCGTDCFGTFAAGTTVTLTATPVAGSTFTGWTGCTATRGKPRECKVPFSLRAAGQRATRSVTATFASHRAYGKGRLLSPVLVFATPPAKKDEYPAWTYHVYFRTEGAFSKRRGDGSHDPGTMKLDDASGYPDEDLSIHGGGKPRGRCYEWFIAATRKDQPRITRKQIGDRVHVQLRLHATSPQARTVRLGAWPTRPSEWPSVRRAVKKIGCHA